MPSFQSCPPLSNNFAPTQPRPSSSQHNLNEMARNVHTRVHHLTPQIPPSQVIGDSTMLAVFDDNFQPVARENNPLNIPIPHLHSRQGSWNKFAPTQARPSHWQHNVNFVSYDFFFLLFYLRHIEFDINYSLFLSRTPFNAT